MPECKLNYSLGSGTGQRRSVFVGDPAQLLKTGACTAKVLLSGALHASPHGQYRRSASLDWTCAASCLWHVDCITVECVPISLIAPKMTSASPSACVHRRRSRRQRAPGAPALIYNSGGIGFWEASDWPLCGSKSGEATRPPASRNKSGAGGSCIRVSSLKKSSCFRSALGVG